MELKRYCPPDMNITTFNNHWDAGRNRYKDVPCQEKFRVVLKWPGSPTDYIHANYVATPISEKRFICTQGPLDCTIADFWHMVIQEDCDNVIMLCNIKEKGMDKCAQYWPLEPKEVQQYGDIQATCTSVQPMENDSTIRFTTINLKWKDDKGQAKERDVRHFQWVDWPDRGVPPCRLTTFELLSRVRGTRKPIVVHCSAGIGRTGRSWPSNSSSSGCRTARAARRWTKSSRNSATSVPTASRRTSNTSSSIASSSSTSARSTETRERADGQVQEIRRRL
ncbi:hypothetical protein L596_013266 [Steinernema carpocapsae]|nr:hypothetical protein L596_013266 [Steinernema carpocapsae]